MLNKIKELLVYIFNRSDVLIVEGLPYRRIDGHMVRTRRR